ncbi:MAG: hypothetical protein H7306_15890 [Bacteriovorax sp.]|nr:hypothetical protein [Rhizobacter sp.]
MARKKATSTAGGQRLVQRIASPTEWRLLRLEHREPVADCIVNVLID